MYCGGFGFFTRDEAAAAAAAASETNLVLCLLLKNTNYCEQVLLLNNVSL